MAAAATDHPSAPHTPVLLRPLLAAVAPVEGVWLDGTFGAGGYTRGLLEAGAERVIGVDRDPLAFEMAAEWAGDYGDRIVMQRGVFSRMDEYAQDLDGVVLDLGVSSMQLDLAERGFSFMRDGPLDMRMSQDGPSAADLVNEAEEELLANILFQYGEERASRRIAKAIGRARAEAPITTTLELASLIEGVLPRSKPGQSHAATRSFQALRIAVNDEYGELFQGLMAAERALKPGGKLAVVTFHSVEDRMVKRFLTARSGSGGNANRFAPEMQRDAPQFTVKSRKAIGPDAEELADNPRSRSAKLRVATRTDAPSGGVDAKSIGMPMVKGL
ncbi:16S rRNA (cytosine(1402)-N(4))-methyltransferase RsmH [Sulfitobacter mediterraneus]|jgi:16S rRNA (cytosine1402-N4)-methyltransferase|uniref:16S rRNA (cytosine(1402)-N(4))-methyltransferase RsmH n=1 Tax=Sulfitobacter TaxID=60136 RepID=UPI0019347C4D|nr:MULTISPECIES: 16S rRNA (cytosine(1402)-N(4))-methyltransferase RsmH [Sulfitobacter]MBM1632497.1 16S rRNA (cytosine(1402)-N(4))-methyltransferase RsmH [Sulfitobacter mediterraneus]MBM1640314.1 16S rRNA (cytosine(1402)-N(4))-methyltransferase RsmH [Sulfitobacter mediterraneus]MBM1644362.1 16S rRNA (cytosine(1402)-N(4))-methyltransferase RsmH [Sulfitobacter mediterraneus]MBM1648409.1 16S rRNA (cytosine(1402)-N(4))-methyltransferase RsmH [Sulfitobacter mediterraneus]MBM1652454.1 16S rRNA (cytos